MPRKRTISNEDLLDVALDLVHDDGPAALSFGALASSTGLAASTLVQRFGTRAELLQATLLRAWDHLDEATAAADERAGDGVDGVVELLLALGGDYDERDHADQLLVLREDLRDPVLRARGAAWIALLTAAVERRVPDVDGELVVAQWQGAVTVWGFTRSAPLPDVVERLLRQLLASA